MDTHTQPSAAAHPPTLSSHSLYNRFRIAALKHRSSAQFASNALHSPTRTSSNAVIDLTQQRHIQSPNEGIAVPSHPTSPTTPSVTSPPTSTDDVTTVDQHRQCKRYLQKALASPMVTYLLNSMEDQQLYVGDPTQFMKCIPCDHQTSGAMYYANDAAGGSTDSEVGIAMCQNHIKSQRDFNVVLTHELVHVYDHARADVDFTRNPYHHACTEIRAANLSGDCTFPRELKRGNLSISNHHNQCVRRRAMISVAANPIAGPEKADEYVDAVWNHCVKDTAPFGSIPWQ